MIGDLLFLMLTLVEKFSVCFRSPLSSFRVIFANCLCIFALFSCYPDNIDVLRETGSALSLFAPFHPESLWIFLLVIKNSTIGELHSTLSC